MGVTSEPLSCQAPAPGSGTDGPAHKARKTRQDEDFFGSVLLG